MEHRQARSHAVTAILLVMSGGMASLACNPSRSPSAAPESRTDPREGRGDTLRASAISPAEIDGQPVRQIEELLEGRVPGVRVVRTPAGGISIRMLGGPTTFLGSNEPLYIVDGMQVHVTQGQGLDWLNPRDIQRIDVLRDASSLSFYGVRGANGVILITTRRGRRK